MIETHIYHKYGFIRSFDHIKSSYLWDLLEDLLDYRVCCEHVCLCIWALEDLVQGRLTQHHSAQNHGNTLSRGSRLHARAPSKNKATGALSTCNSDQEVNV